MLPVLVVVHYFVLGLLFVFSYYGNDVRLKLNVLTACGVST
jgi:hypothetical protein